MNRKSSDQPYDHVINSPLMVYESLFDHYIHSAPILKNSLSLLIDIAWSAHFRHQVGIDPDIALYYGKAVTQAYSAIGRTIDSATFYDAYGSEELLERAKVLNLDLGHDVSLSSAIEAVIASNEHFSKLITYVRLYSTVLKLMLTNQNPINYLRTLKVEQLMLLRNQRSLRALALPPTLTESKVDSVLFKPSSDIRITIDMPSLNLQNKITLAALSVL